MSFETQRSGMSAGARRVIASRRWLVALAGGVLAAATLAPGAAQAATPHERVTGHVRAWHGLVGETPTETIDASTDPQDAGQALNTGCADLSQCNWKTTSPITVGYGPAQILGDALYNCSDPANEQANSENAVQISDEREESTSISESLSVEVGLGFLDLEKSSLEAEVSSKQLESFSTEVTTTNAVVVPPGWEGWTETKVLTASVTGDAYITAGINKLIEVKNIDLNFPGYQDPSTPSDSPILYIGYLTSMTPADSSSRCAADKLPGSGGLGASPGGKRAAAPTVRFQLTLCSRGGSCTTPSVVGTSPPAVGRATATLTRGGRTYAAGTDTSGRIQLTTQLPVRPGRYELTLTEHPVQSPHGRALTALNTMVPITIR